MQYVSLWSTQSPEDERRDTVAWTHAASERGGFWSVLWTELKQLVLDVFPRKS